ncbi:MAG: hypothetical protein AAFY57_11615 [Cyanobacteria bacterium J06642_2]
MDIDTAFNRLSKTSIVLTRTVSVRATDGWRRLRSLTSDSGTLALSRLRVFWSDVSASVGQLSKR